ncbi:MAG: hypothetical protein P9L93_00105 [Candidatus Gorgyraea atricola]|nr:hypothetical protein [Candidatus Gorgyraea atricola]
MKKLMIMLMVGLLVVGSSAVYAVGEDSDVETSAVSLTIPHAAKLVISQSASSKTLVQDSDAETDFDTGYTDLDAGKPNLKVSANKNWVLSAKSSGFATVGTYDKLVGDLQLLHTGSYVAGGFDSFTGLALIDQSIATNAIGVKNENYDCQYRILLDYTKDVPGEYTATVTYTLATQS